MNGLENYSRKQRKNIKHLLGGRGSALNVLIGCWIFIAFVMVIMVIGEFLSDDMEKDLPFFLGMFVFFSAFLVFLSFGIAKFRKVKSNMKSYFASQPDWCKAEIKQCASDYKAKYGIQCSSNYIFGMMQIGIGAKEKQFRVLGFHYLPYCQLLWVYKNDRDLLMKTDFMNLSNYIGNAQNYEHFKIYDSYGNVYLAPIRNTDAATLFSTIHRINPSCHIGYNQDNIDWMNQLRKSQNWL